jgi:hypothetical protein
MAEKQGLQRRSTVNWDANTATSNIFSIFDSKREVLRTKREQITQEMKLMTYSEKDYFISLYDAGDAMNQPFIDETKSTTKHKSMIESIKVASRTSSKSLDESNTFLISKTKGFSNSKYHSVFTFSDRLKSVIHLKDRKITHDTDLGSASGHSAVTTALDQLMDEIAIEERRFYQEKKSTPEVLRIFLTIGTSAEGSLDQTKSQILYQKLMQLRENYGENLHIRLEHYSAKSNDVNIHNQLNSIMFSELSKVYSNSTELHDDYKKHALILNHLYKLNFQFKEEMLVILQDRATWKLFDDYDASTSKVLQLVKQAMAQKQAVVTLYDTLEKETRDILPEQLPSMRDIYAPKAANLLRSLEKIRSEVMGLVQQKRNEGTLKNLEVELQKKADYFSKKRYEAVQLTGNIFLDQTLAGLLPVYGDMVAKLQNYVRVYETLADYSVALIAIVKQMEIDIIEGGLDLRATVNNYVIEKRVLFDPKYFNVNPEEVGNWPIVRNKYKKVKRPNYDTSVPMKIMEFINQQTSKSQLGKSGMLPRRGPSGMNESYKMGGMNESYKMGGSIGQVNYSEEDEINSLNMAMGGGGYQQGGMPSTYSQSAFGASKGPSNVSIPKNRQY